MPTWDKMYSYKAEDNPFQVPVDPVKYKIPNYFDIVHNPMDLSTIKTKLTTGQYKNPWEYIGDVWLMFTNAWLYNRKKSYVHEFCTEVCTCHFVQTKSVQLEKKSSKKFAKRK